MNNVELLQKAGIDTGRHTTGTIKVLCPNCSHKRKNKKEPCLSVNIEDGVYNCHNDCGFKGKVFERRVREFEKPVPRLEKLNPKVINWFEKERKISNNTLLRFKITETVEWMPQDEKEMRLICFNYYRGDSLVNIKFRSSTKGFRMAKDAELVFYNLNAIDNEKECVIVEGEIDCLSFHESGIYNCVSVPNGASKGNQKLEYLDNCWQYFDKIDKIILAVDNDEAGTLLREELARRLGKDKCWTVEYPEDCKDANEVLCKYGSQAVKDLVKFAKIWPLEGEATMDELFPVVQDWFLNGYPPGAKARIDGFDDLLTFGSPELTMVTGIPGSGKDEFVNLITTSLAKYEGWEWGIWGYEESPQVTVTKLIEKFTGKSFDFRVNPDHRISESMFEHGVALVDRYFKFMNTDEVEATIDAIIEQIGHFVKRYGIKGVVISPWNCLEHKKSPGQSETEYVSEVLSKLLRCLKRHNLHCILLAHPTKLQKDKATGLYDIPTLYSISGSAHFFNKTQNGFSVYRDFNTNVVTVYVQKVKFSWLGKLGQCSFTFDTFTRQYQPIIQ